MHLARICSLILASIYAERLRDRWWEDEALRRWLDASDQLITTIGYERQILVRQVRDCHLQRTGPFKTPFANRKGGEVGCWINPRAIVSSYYKQAIVWINASATAPKTEDLGWRDTTSNCSAEEGRVRAEWQTGLRTCIQSASSTACQFGSKRTYS
jgi:hypothetical protein